MNEITTIFSDSLKGLGRSFMVAHYLPAVVLVIVHLYLLLPMWTGGSSMLVAGTQQLFLPASSTVELDSFVDTLLLPLLASLITLLLLTMPVGVVLAILNDLLIRMFEGKLPWLRWGLLYPLTQRNQVLAQQHAARYESVTELQAEYRRVSSALLQTNQASASNNENEAEYLTNLRAQVGLAHQIDAELSQIHADNPPLVPRESYRVAPTRFGNVYALAEAYSFERYGVDTVLFWPRLRQLMAKHVPDHSMLISQQKTTLDLTINAAFVSGLLALEALVSFPFYPSVYFYPLLTVLLLGGGLAVGFYYAAVGAIFTLGELIKISFDYHRQLILDAFQINQPDHLMAERDVWIKLARFIMWGDVSYLLEARAIGEHFREE
ncbi:hypothetical protein QUF58_03920 [Anaerolineales bacterium HSG24]|nr:hypothetical protein [Anaerolineales bacterium HSG24]